MSRQRGPETIAPAIEPEQFMALLLHAQSDPCNCVFAKYFRKLGENMKKKYIKESE